MKQIPAWIKNNAGWWATDQIDDSSFLKGIQYLIQNDIIYLKILSVDSSTTESGIGTSDTIPEWVKNTAGWWADDQIDDETFVNAIQYLIREGLIQT